VQVPYFVAVMKSKKKTNREVMVMETIYPEVEVKLISNDGNAFAVIGAVRKAMRRAKIDPDKIKEFETDAMSGDYNNVLRTCMKWVTVK